MDLQTYQCSGASTGQTDGDDNYIPSFDTLLQYNLTNISVGGTCFDG